MGRRLLFLVLALAPLRALAAQAPRVSLAVTLSPPVNPNGQRRPRVQVRDLLADPRWSQALLEQSFPLRLTFRLEIWRSREGWIDEFQRATEWSTVIQSEPLEEQFKVTRIFRSGPEEFRFATQDSLERWIRSINEVDALPQGTGTFYYNVTLTITALSDADMEELDRFLNGDVGPPPTSPQGSLGKSVRRFLLRMAGLPWDELEARSDRFRVIGRR